MCRYRKEKGIEICLEKKKKVVPILITVFLLTNPTLSTHAVVFNQTIYRLNKNRNRSI